MSINIQFGGTNIQRPGAYSAVDTENMTPVAAGSFKTIGIIGIPNMVNTVTAQAQTINNTVQGTITTAGNIKVTVTAANLTGSPIVCSVAVALNDTVVAIAGKIVTALQNNANINGFFSITNTGATLNLTALKAADNDTTMHVTIANDSTAGLTTSESTITIQGISAFIPYFNDSIAAKQALGECKALDLMNIAWTHGADLIAFSPVAQTGTDADWQKAIDALQSEDIDAIIAATNAQPINAKLLAHCSFMSNTANRKERRFFAGHATNLSTTQIKALQTALNTELGVMASPGVYYYDSDGNKVLQGSEYLAAAYAGLWVKQATQEPLTYKYVTFPGLEKNYIGTEITDLLSGHIAPVEYVKNKGYRIVQGVTLSASDDLSQQELSVSSIKVEISKKQRDALESKFVGRAGEKGIEVTIYNDLISLIESDFLKNGLIIDYDRTSVKVIKQNTTFITQWQATPTLPINNFLITTHLSL